MGPRKAKRRQSKREGEDNPAPGTRTCDNGVDDVEEKGRRTGASVGCGVSPCRGRGVWRGGGLREGGKRGAKKKPQTITKKRGRCWQEGEKETMTLNSGQKQR